jgi:putative membrane protein
MKVLMSGFAFPTTKEIMRTKTILGTALFTGLVLLVSTARSSAAEYQTGTSADMQRGQLSSKDYHFLTEAARGGLEEVQMGQLAREKGASQGVRDFGERMVTDHTRANDELKQIAMQKGATPPMELSHGEQSKLDHLQKVSGADFDKAYTKDMVKDHKKDVKAFRKASKDLDDPDLRAFAQKTLPTLEQHQQLAENLETTVKNENLTGSK